MPIHYSYCGIAVARLGGHPEWKPGAPDACVSCTAAWNAEQRR